ncbi:MAG: hypothetical protein ABI557_07870, partial [Aureliella sp.]
ATVGIWLGQILLAVLIAALAGRTWIEGFSIGLTLTLLGVATFACSMLALGETQSFSTDELASVAAIPSLLFAACIPLTFFRQWRGWRFISTAREPTSASQAASQPMSIEGLFLSTAVVAASLILARIPAVIWDVETRYYWLYLAGGGLCLSTWTAILSVPTCWLVFRIHGWYRLRAALVSLWLVGIAMGVTAIYVASYLSGSQPLFLLEVVPFMALAGALMATLLVGLLMFRFTGYTLGKRHKRSNATLINATTTHPSRASATNTARALAAVFLVVAGIANIPAARVELARRQQDQVLDKLSRQAWERGGSIGVQNHKLTSLTAWPEMTDADLHDIDLSAVHTLSLAGSQVTDAILPELNTGRLFYLDLSGTQISELALAQSGLTYLQQLKLSSPQFTGKCFATWPLRISELDLSNSGVSDETLFHVKQLVDLDTLDVSHTAVTDDGLELLAGMRLEYINISDTRITAECVRALKLAEQIVITAGQFSSIERLSLVSSGLKVREESGR